MGKLQAVPEAALASPEGSRAGQKGPTSHPSGSRGSEGASRRLALTGSEWRETLRAVVGSGSVRHKRPQSSAGSSKRWWGEWMTDSGFPRAPQGYRAHPSRAHPPAPVWLTVASGSAPFSGRSHVEAQRAQGAAQHRGSEPHPHLRPPPPLQACTSLFSLPVPLPRPCDSEAWGAAASLWLRPPWRCCLGVGGTQLPAYEEGPLVPRRA